MLRPWRQEKMAGRLRCDSYWKIHGARTHAQSDSTAIRGVGGSVPSSV